LNIALESKRAELPFNKGKISVLDFYMDQRDFRMVKPDINLQYSSTWKRIASSLEIAKISHQAR